MGKIWEFFDNLNEVVDVWDMEAHELVYMNKKTLELYDRIINPDLLIRRIYVTACHVRTEQEAQKEQTYEQMSLFDFTEETEEQKAQKQALQKEKQMQKAMLSIKQRYGKNAILKGTNFKEGATMRQRNGQIGGHRA